MRNKTHGNNSLEIIMHNIPFFGKLDKGVKDTKKKMVNHCALDCKLLVCSPVQHPPLFNTSY